MDFQLNGRKMEQDKTKKKKKKKKGAQRIGLDWKGGNPDVLGWAKGLISGKNTKDAMTEAQRRRHGKKQ